MSVYRHLLTVLMLVLGFSRAGYADYLNCSTPANDCEAAYLKTHRALVKREGHRLSITLSNGHKKVFQDNGKMNGLEKFDLYRFVHVYPNAGYALIDKEQSDGTSFHSEQSYLLLNLSSGVTQEMLGIPVLSPDFKHAASGNACLGACYDLNALMVFRLEPKGFFKELELYPEDWGAGELVWESNTTLRFNRYTFDGEAEDLMRAEPRTLRYRGEPKKGVWQVE